MNNRNYIAPFMAKPRYDTDTERLGLLRSEFPILERCVYLNSCSLGALSRQAVARLDGFLDDWHGLGASAWYSHWLTRLEELRTRVANFWGSRSTEVALLPSVSAAISVLAHAGERRAQANRRLGPERNKVVCTELDFPTLAYQWAVKPNVELVVLESPDGIRIDPEQFDRAVDERTLFVATSHVFFTTGYRQDLAVLADIAHQSGALCVVDGYQGAGQVPLSLCDTGIDAYVAGPLKWLCGGPGLAYLYVREDLIRELDPTFTSWFATENQFDFNLRRFSFRHDARRFELGTPALPTVHTALGGQEVIDEARIGAVVKHNSTLTNCFIEGARAKGFTVRVPPAESRTAIAMVRHEDPVGAVRFLAERDIIVDHRPGFVRVSPHFYNTADDLHTCIEALAEFGGQGSG